MILNVILITILVIAAILGVLSHYVLSKEGDVYVTPVKGFLIGVLFSDEVQELINNETEETVGYQTGYTIQIGLFFVTFTFVWNEEIDEF